MIPDLAVKVTAHITGQVNISQFLRGTVDTVEPDMLIIELLEFEHLRVLEQVEGGVSVSGGLEDFAATHDGLRCAKVCAPGLGVGFPVERRFVLDLGPGAGLREGSGLGKGRAGEGGAECDEGCGELHVGKGDEV